MNNLPLFWLIRYISVCVWRDNRTQINFFKKDKPSKKGQKRPTKCWKKLNTQLKTAEKEPNASLDKAKFLKTICLLTTQIHIKIHLVCSQVTAPPQKVVNLKLFLEFVTYDRNMPKFFLFKNTWTNLKVSEKSTVSSASSLKFWTLPKQSLQFTVTS